MNEVKIKVVKTKWWKMRKVKKRCKKFNKKYGNKAYTPGEIDVIFMEWNKKQRDKDERR